MAVPGSYGVSGVNGVTMLAPISGQSPGLARAQVSHGVRQVGVSNLELTLESGHVIFQIVLCKDKDNKVGLKVKAVNKGVFVCLVAKESPAALGGLRSVR